MAVGGGFRRPQRIAAGMRRLVEQRRIVDASRLAVEGRVGRARKRDRRFGAVGSVHPRDNHPREGSSGAGERLDRLGEPLQREGLARAGGAGDRRQKRRLDLPGHAKLRQRLHDGSRVEHVGAVGGIGKKDGRRRFLRKRRRGGVRAVLRRLGKRRGRRRLRRVSAEQANFHFLADLRQTNLLSAAGPPG